MGPDSKVSTLCHELSHFHRVERKNEIWNSEQEKANSRGPGAELEQMIYPMMEIIKMTINISNIEKIKGCSQS